jgi:hypothetical protein
MALAHISIFTGGATAVARYRRSQSFQRAVS